jgi:signal peptide peptidase SppA
MKRTTILNLLAEPLAMYQPTLQEQLLRFRADVNRPQPADINAAAGAYVPAVNDLIVADGVAVVQLHGMMVKRSRVLLTWYDSVVLLGSDDVAELVDQLAARADVHTIVIDADTGGGQVAGTQRLADAVFRARESTNVVGVVNEMAASAGLWVVSQCDRVVINASGTIGSLGVYMVHLDDSKWLEDLGLEKTVIHRGKYKAAFERPLNSDTSGQLQDFIDTKFTLFVDAVARGRGLDSAEVLERWGESQLVVGRDAVDAGLADELGTLQDVLEELKAGTAGESVPIPATETTPEGSKMKTNEQGQILDDSGKVVGNVADLQLSADGLRKHFAALVDEVVAAEVEKATAAAAEELKTTADTVANAAAERLDALVAAVGADAAVVAFKAGHTVEQAKAAQADTLAAENERLRKELAEAKANPGSAAGNGKAPKFKASDHGTATGTAGGNSDDPEAGLRAEWDANAGECQDKHHDFSTYAAFRRYEIKQAERRAAM